MKVFISQPMANRGQEEIENERDMVMDFAKENFEGQTVNEIASYFGPTAKFTPLESLGLAIQMMSRADVVIFVPGWKDSRGCQIERQCAEAYGLEIVDFY